MLNLDGGNSFGNCKYYYASYKLLNKEVYDLRVGGDLFKTRNYIRELLRVSEPRGVVKTKRSGSCFVRSSLGNIEK